MLSKRLQVHITPNDKKLCYQSAAMSTTVKMDYESTYKKSARRFHHREHLLLGGGPTNCSERVLSATAMQCQSPLSQEMFDTMDDVKEMMQYVYQTKNTFTLTHQTSGNGGNEAIVLNLLDPGDKLIIAIGGFWGEKVLDMARRHNVDVLPLRKPPGEIYSLEELEAAIKSHKADLLFVTHGESTGATLQKMEGLGAMCHKHNCLLAVDAVVSIVVDPLFVDRWEIDAVNAGSQKAIGAPPGLCLLSFSPRAEKRMRAKKTRTPYYMDMLLQGQYWKCFEDLPRTYHYTFSSCQLSGLREALAQICEEGLPEMWERHRRNAEYFWKRLNEIGFGNFVKNPDNRFHGVTGVNIPEGVSEAKFLAFLKKKYAIDITCGAGPTLNKAMRVGLMGQNSRPEVADYLIKALEDGLQQFKSGAVEM